MPSHPSRLRADVLSAAMGAAARRCGWSLSAERAGELAQSALPTLQAFEPVLEHIDFDSDPLAFQSVCNAVKHHDGR